FNQMLLQLRTSLIAQISVHIFMNESDRFIAFHDRVPLSRITEVRLLVLYTIRATSIYVSKKVFMVQLFSKRFPSPVYPRLNRSDLHVQHIADLLQGHVM